MPPPSAADPDEVARFEAAADAWWDESGPAAPLHAIAPARLEVVRDALAERFGRDAAAPAPFAGLRVLDAGCGGGLACEPLARLGARVTGIDPGERAIAAARRHAALFGLEIDYRVLAAEELAGEEFDAVLALEAVEHAADRGAFLAAAARCVAPGGVLVASTLNRTARAFALAIIGAEYVLRWVPRGTHRWRKFVRPSELLGALEANGLRALGAAGLSWRPAARRWAVTRDLSVNYMVWAGRDDGIEPPARPASLDTRSGAPHTARGDAPPTETRHGHR